MICEIRKRHPRAGTRKLMVYLREELEVANIKIGRDALGKLLRENNLLVPKTKRFHTRTSYVVQVSRRIPNISFTSRLIC